ncbi:MAG: CAAX protease, partial [Cyclobacteriaceae bacterium]
KINMLRNRLAHHEPICFANGQAVKNTTYARQHYAQILELFRWMNINVQALLYGLDHIETVADQIDAL